MNLSNWEHCLFLLFGILACGGAVSVVLCQNIARMAFSLIVALASVSAIFFLLSADFVGATQLMVYVGGTIVLLIFGVMLTSSAPMLKIRTSPADGFIAAFIGVMFLMIIAFTVGRVDWDQTPAPADGYNAAADGNTVRPLAFSFVGLRPDKTDGPANELPTGYLLPFEIISVHLLVVLVGAAYLARSKRRVQTQPSKA